MKLCSYREFFQAKGGATAKSMKKKPRAKREREMKGGRTLHERSLYQDDGAN